MVAGHYNYHHHHPHHHHHDHHQSLSGRTWPCHWCGWRWFSPGLGLCQILISFFFLRQFTWETWRTFSTMEVSRSLSIPHLVLLSSVSAGNTMWEISLLAIKILLELDPVWLLRRFCTAWKQWEILCFSWERREIITMRTLRLGLRQTNQNKKIKQIYCF